MKDIKSSFSSALSILAFTATTFLIILPAVNAHASGSKNATGRITRLEQSAMSASVNGYVQGGDYLWLGLSYKCGEKGAWQDREPKQVTKGSFSNVRFQLGFCLQYRIVRSCLWKEKGTLMRGRVHCDQN